MALAYAAFSSLCFGVALITGRFGLREIDARSGAAISIPTATLLFLIATPFALDTSGFDYRAALVFGAVGLLFPALVTLLTFRSNELLGPTVTSAVSGTAPLFAIVAAALLIGERIPPEAVVSAAGVVSGVALLTWRRGALERSPVARFLLWPVAGALVRGIAQAGAKAGLLLWANAFAAGLIGYLVSSVAVIAAHRARGSARRPITRRGLLWFAATGILNGAAVLLLYAALSTAPVWTVAPIVATYPLITAVLGALVLRDEKLTLQAAAGASITVAAIVYLVSSRPF